MRTEVQIVRRNDFKADALINEVCIRRVNAVDVSKIAVRDTMFFKHINYLATLNTVPNRREVEKNIFGQAVIGSYR
jgi:hypothetical protein